MSKSNIGDKVRELVFGKSAGRCEYQGCNKLLTIDDLTRRPGKFSAYAHIIADSPKGPRGDAVQSNKLKSDISNIMVLCLDHHKLIDVDDVESHPVDLLREMKQKHEARVERLTAIDSNHKTIIVILEANIGERKGTVDTRQAERAVLPKYPFEIFRIELSRLSIADGSLQMWNTGVEEISAKVSELQSMLVRSGVSHVSIFAMAPMPLLMWLGRQIGDIASGAAFQRHRQTEDWQWREPSSSPVEFSVIEPEVDSSASDVALVLSISDKISADRLAHIPISKNQIFHIEPQCPSIDVIRTYEDVIAFKVAAQRALRAITDAYGQRVRVHVFPAAPNSLCVEFGRLLLPKAYPETIVYDWNNSVGGWIRAVALIESSG